MFLLILIEWGVGLCVSLGQLYDYVLDAKYR